jgi:adenylate cyclase
MTMQKDEKEIEEVWRRLFELGEPELKKLQAEFIQVVSPTQSRCKLCFFAFDQVGVQDRKRSQRNPYFCNKCDEYITENAGGANVNISVIFVDVRSSVSIAEDMDPNDFRKLMGKYFYAATLSLLETEGFIIEFIGDAVAAIYPPGFSGDYSSKAIAGAEKVLRAKMPSLPNGDELPIGVGVHTGIASIGTVQSALNGYLDVQPFGDNVNVASRLSGMALPGQALISEATLLAAEVETGGLNLKEYKVEGRRATISACPIDRRMDLLPTRLVR